MEMNELAQEALNDDDSGSDSGREERHQGAIAAEETLNKLLNEVGTMEHQIKNILVPLNKPNKVTEPERYAIWSAINLEATITIFDVRCVFERLKPFSIKRKEDINWFQWIHWVFWG